MGSNDPIYVTPVTANLITNDIDILIYPLDKTSFIYYTVKNKGIEEKSSYFGSLQRVPIAEMEQ